MIVCFSRLIAILSTSEESFLRLMIVRFPRVTAIFSVREGSIYRASAHLVDASDKKKTSVLKLVCEISETDFR